MVDEKEIRSTQVGVVGLGLMGSSIVVSLLASGHRVVALTPIAIEREKGARHIADLLRHADLSGLLPKGMDASIESLSLTDDYEQLSGCRLVLECVVEDKGIKGAVYGKIASSVPSDTIIASNTSAIPISELQALVPHPERFLGLHWAEPAYMTKFLEVTCGTQTDEGVAKYIMELGVKWGKESTLLRKDIRGFITNRLMYAVYREALTLIEQGHTTLADADKAFRYDVGSWITFMGIFRRMDFMGIVDYARSFEQLFKQLSNTDEVPGIMRRVVERQGRGIHNQIGLFEYTEAEAKAWDQAFAQFNRDIYELAAKYSEQWMALKNDEQLAQ